MRKNFIVVIALFALVLTAIFYSGQTNDVKADGTQIQLAGTIRNDGKGWSALNDSSHSPINIQSVVAEKDRIKINHNVGAKRVATFIVTVDETMAKEGYTVGISGGLTYSYIYIYDKNRVLIDPAKYANQWGNIWIYGMLTN